MDVGTSKQLALVSERNTDSDTRTISSGFIFCAASEGNGVFLGSPTTPVKETGVPETAAAQLLTVQSAAQLTSVQAAALLSSLQSATLLPLVQSPVSPLPIAQSPVLTLAQPLARPAPHLPAQSPLVQLSVHSSVQPQSSTSYLKQGTHFIKTFAGSQKLALSPLDGQGDPFSRLPPLEGPGVSVSRQPPLEGPRGPSSRLLF